MNSKEINSQEISGLGKSDKLKGGSAMKAVGVES
jgi:hypothetical protein